MNVSELEVIKADLLTANMILKDNTGAKYNAYMVNMSAYHSGQAIEKCLKAIARENGDLDDTVALSHSVEKLLLKAELHDEGFIQKHKYIAKNADTISKFNGLRYGMKSIALSDAKDIYFHAKELHKELEQRYMEKNKVVLKDCYRSKSKTEYNKLEKLKFER